MSPIPLHPKTETTTSVNKGQTHLKINRDSHSIKKPSSSSLSSSPSPSNKQQRQPVIIYTHSPRIIHTNPRDFMQLVQKLTGLSRSKEQREEQEPQPKPEPEEAVSVPVAEEVEYPMMKAAVCKDENETSSVIMEESSCISSSSSSSRRLVAAPPLMEPPMIPFVNRLPVFGPSSAEFLMCSNKALFSYADPLFF